MQKDNDFSFLNPNFQKTKEYVKTAKTKMQSMRYHKHVEFSNWQDSLRRFEVLLFEKDEITKHVYAGMFETLPRYYSALYNIFNYMVSLFPKNEFTYYSMAFESLFYEIHTKKHTGYSKILLLMKLKRIDEALMQLKEQYGLGLASITKSEKNDDDLYEYMMGEKKNGSRKNKSKKQDITTTKSDDI